MATSEGHGENYELVTDSAIGRWLGDVRVGNEARIRGRQRWLEQQATEQATLIGALCDLTESGAEVVIETRSGRRHTGSIHAVAIDFCAVAAANRWVFVPIRSVAAIRSTAASTINAAGDRSASLDLTLLEALADQLEDRPRIVVWLESGQRVQGELAGVGQDLITVRVDGDPPRPAHVAIEAISEIGL